MDDIIYRQDAIEAACRGCSGDFYQECQAYHGKKTFCDQIKRLRAVPSAQGFADTAYMEKMSELTFDSAFELGKAFAQSEIIRCKDCEHFHYDMVIAHEVCDFWGDGCKVTEDGFCSFAERSTND